MTSEELEGVLQAAKAKAKAPRSREELLAAARELFARAEADGTPFKDLGVLLRNVMAEGEGEAVPPAFRTYTTEEALHELWELWKSNDPPVSTGLAQLDAVMAGGLRAGDVIAVAGSAKGGKSAFAGGIAYAAAKWRGPNERRAVVVYASVEMPAYEVNARWVTAEAYRLRKEELAEQTRKPVRQQQEVARHVSFTEVIYGGAWRGEGVGLLHQTDVRQRLTAARGEVARHDNLTVTRLPPGSTAHTLRELVLDRRQREQKPPALTVLVVDPIQRFYAAEQGALTGRTLDAANSNETERMSIVSQQVKELADELGLAVLFTSDGTKASAGGGLSSAQSLRGSYHLNHLATTIMGIRTGKTPEDLAEKLGSGDEKSGAASLNTLMAEREPWKSDSEEQMRLGQRLAFVDMSGHRRGPANDMVFRFVPGAMTFVELPPKARK
jgi:replicative DNA helicase